jgi:hypothetical protein
MIYGTGEGVNNLNQARPSAEQDRKSERREDETGV